MSDYQGREGAIRVHSDGVWVDPYFAGKALIEARRAGLDIDGPARAWVAWALARQLPDGRFERYCQSLPESQEWLACASADADDASLALWLHLLMLLEPDAGRMPVPWRESMHKARRQLARLYNPRLGVYQISLSQPVGLFMDNVEVYAALHALGRLPGRSGKAARAGAARLKRNMMKAFWDGRGKRFRPSTQVFAEHRFYPQEVAQIYPWLDGLPTPQSNIARAYRRWMKHNGSAWLGLGVDDYPWGLVALTALRMGDKTRASCWLTQAAPLRGGPRWNVLEEAAYQALQFRLAPVAESFARCVLGGRNSEKGGQS